MTKKKPRIWTEKELLDLLMRKARDRCYRERNKEILQERKKQWYRDNAMEVSDKRKIYYVKNKRKILVKKKKYYQENKDQIKLRYVQREERL